MKILEYNGLDTSRHLASYRKTVAALERGDFRSAEVKKLSNISHGTFYRAKLDYANRLLFTLLSYKGEQCALMLEIIEQHKYESSRFLRGAVVDEDQLPEIEPIQAAREATPVRYLHPERRTVHLLGKVIAFDDIQDRIFRIRPPVIIVGSAGSGKTTLTLEKLKQTEGEVLYVTLSAYLAQTARNLYYSDQFDKEGQEVSFFSYRELLESIRIPSGREVGWREFAGWFSRMRQQFIGLDPHQVFEEIRGVVTASIDGPLTFEAYLNLGIRQSIFTREQREELYDLYRKYLAWLEQNSLYDTNLLAYQWQQAAQPRYDFVVVDEIQDITPVQLALILKLLKRPGQFMLCGDSNQIVHPNFFSWSAVKTLFWQDPLLAGRQELQILQANYRNSPAAVSVANTLLKIKQKRFGSVDRESNFLVESTGGEAAGEVQLLQDKDTIKQELDRSTRNSAQVAVLVLRDEDKAAVRRFFKTPLVFSIHEAKGLEYENIILYRFISDNRAEYSEITQGIQTADLLDDELAYSRGKDKSDKSLEIYKFYVNALYVALTRAVKNVYLVESNTEHRLLDLLGLRTAAQQVRMKVAASSLDDWQREARKLELQGKQEQADAIRKDILKEKPVPWPVHTEAWLRDTLAKAFGAKPAGSKYKQQLYEYATVYDGGELAGQLHKRLNHPQAAHFREDRTTLRYRHMMIYYRNNLKEVLQQCDQYGTEHRTAMNLTPLITAAIAGNLPLVEELLKRGANLQASDDYGCNALHWALREAFFSAGYANKSFGPIYELIAPSSIDVKVDDRLVRIDKHQAEYLLFQTFWATTRLIFLDPYSTHQGGTLKATVIEDYWHHLPSSVVIPRRKQRQHISSVLSRNEVARDYAYNRRLFQRYRQGLYQLNPRLAVRQGQDGDWQPLLERLNLRLIAELTPYHYQQDIQWLLKDGGLPALAEAILGVPDYIKKLPFYQELAAECQKLTTEKRRDVF